jgi:hypothetical protein
MFSKTIWIIFLEEMYFIMSEQRMINKKERPFDLVRAWAIAATMFLEHGADVHAMIVIEDWSSMERMLQYEPWNTISGALPNAVHVSLQLSNFSIFELCLEGVPGWPQIRDVCDAKGAQTYSRCTRLKISRGMKVHYEHSREPLNGFFELFVRYTKPVWTSNLANTVLELRRLIIRYFEDACEKSIDGQNSPPDSDLDNYESCNEASPKIEHHALELQ